MIRKLWQALAAIRNADRIPKLPRDMLASKYETIDKAERRVLARLGARDPAGIKVALRRYGVSSIPELMQLLEHQKPRRNIGKRIRQALGRLVGGYDHDPHREEILRDERARRRSNQHIEIEQRVKRTAQSFRQED